MSSERCPLFRVSFIERFHCIYIADHCITAGIRFAQGDAFDSFVCSSDWMAIYLIALESAIHSLQH